MHERFTFDVIGRLPHGTPFTLRIDQVHRAVERIEAGATRRNARRE